MLILQSCGVKVLKNEVERWSCAGGWPVNPSISPPNFPPRLHANRKKRYSLYVPQSEQLCNAVPDIVGAFVDSASVARALRALTCTIVGLANQKASVNARSQPALSTAPRTSPISNQEDWAQLGKYLCARPTSLLFLSLEQSIYMT